MSGAEPPREDASRATPAVDRCPLCGNGNACAMAGAGEPGAPCWCVAVSFDAELLARVPLGARDRACICAACAAASKARA